MKKFGLMTFGFLTIYAIYFVCQTFVQHFNIHFPAPIAGIIILFILLKTGVISEELIKDSCNFLLKYMMLFFIPLFVGITKYADLIYQNFLPVIFTVFFTTFLIMIFVGLFYENALKYLRLYKIRRGKK